MVWKKVVQVVAVSECPKCGNRAFDHEPETTIDDPQGLVRCGKCSYVCPSSEFVRPVEGPKRLMMSCPFKVGDLVMYRPSEKGAGLSANNSPWETPKAGETVKIAAITDGKYLTVEGYQHPGDGLHWSEFSAA